MLFETRTSIADFGAIIVLSIVFSGEGGTGPTLLAPGKRLRAGASGLPLARAGRRKAGVEVITIVGAELGRMTCPIIRDPVEV